MAASPAAPDPAPKPAPATDAPAEMGHPRGTLAIVALYALLLALGWAAMYVTFLGRGAPR
jgi:hypothetical protein